MKIPVLAHLAVLALALNAASCAQAPKESPLAACLAAHDLDKVLGACAEVIDSKTASPRDRAIAYTYRAGALQASGRSDEAMADSNSAVALAPNDADALAGRGSIFLARKQFEPAIRDLEAAMKANSNHVIAMGNRGIIHEQLGEWEQAGAMVDRVLRIEPDSMNGWGEQCWIGAASAPDAASALPDCGKAIELSDVPNNYNSRGLAYYRAGKYRESIADYDHSIEGDPRVGSSFYMRGLAKAASGMEGAQADIAKGLELEPGVRERYVGMGILKG